MLTNQILASLVHVNHHYFFRGVGKTLCGSKTVLISQEGEPQRSSYPDWNCVGTTWPNQKALKTITVSSHFSFKQILKNNEDVRWVSCIRKSGNPACPPSKDTLLVSPEQPQCVECLLCGKTAASDSWEIDNIEAGKNIFWSRPQWYYMMICPEGIPEKVGICPPAMYVQVMETPDWIAMPVTKWPSSGSYVGNIAFQGESLRGSRRSCYRKRQRCPSGSKWPTAGGPLHFGPPKCCSRPKLLKSVQNNAAGRFFVLWRAASNATSRGVSWWAVQECQIQRKHRRKIPSSWFCQSPWDR